MKNNLRRALSNLGAKEKSTFRFLILLYTAINIIDVASIVLVLIVVRFYTQSGSINTITPFITKYLKDRHSFLPIIFLLALFMLKNIAGYIVNKKQLEFIHHVANGISRRNLTSFLYGPYSNYINIDSSVFIRKIIYQPAEFAQHVLLSFQKVIIELILIFFSITAYLFITQGFLLLLP